MVTACSLPLHVRVEHEDVVAVAVARVVASSAVAARDAVRAVESAVEEARAVVNSVVDVDAARAVVDAAKAVDVVAVEDSPAPTSPTPALSPAWAHRATIQVDSRCTTQC